MTPRHERGLLCRCSVCGREERAGESPLRNGWPRCCGYTMTLIDTARFIASVDQEVGQAFAAVSPPQPEGDTGSGAAG